MVVLPGRKVVTEENFWLYHFQEAIEMKSLDGTL